MVSAAFFSVPSLWGVHLNAIQSPPIDIKELTASHKFVPESHVRELLNPFENVFENNGWGSLGHHSSHQVQIEPQSSVTSEFQRSINDKFKFGQVKKNEVQEFEMEKILFSDLTYVNVNIPDSYVPTGDELYILDVGEVKFSNRLPLKRTWKPPWPPPYLQSYFCPNKKKTCVRAIVQRVNQGEIVREIEEINCNSLTTELDIIRTQGAHAKLNEASLQFDESSRLLDAKIAPSLKRQEEIEESSPKVELSLKDTPEQQRDLVQVIREHWNISESIKTNISESLKRKEELTSDIERLKERKIKEEKATSLYLCAIQKNSEHE